MRRRILFFFAGLTGCGLPGLLLKPPGGGSSSCAMGSTTYQNLPIAGNVAGGALLTGMAQTISYDDSTALDCSSAAPKSVQSTVTDPTGTPVSSSATVATFQPAAGGTPASLVFNVAFTPPVAGWYSIHLDVPPLSPVDTTAFVAESRMETGSPVPFQSCKTLDRTTAGTWVCDGTAGQTKLGANAAVSGNVVWAVDNDSSIVSRYMDTGGILSMTHQVSVNQLYGADQMVASTDALAFSYGNQVFWFTVQGAALTATAPLTLQQIMSPLTLVGTPTALIAAGALNDGLSFVACQVQPGATPSCQALTGQIVGSDGNNLWAVASGGGGSGFLQAYPAVSNGLGSVAQTSLPQQQISLMPPPSLVVTLLPQTNYPQGAAPRVESGSVVLDVYDTSHGAQLVGVGGNWVWELTVNGTLTAFPR